VRAFLADMDARLNALNPDRKPPRASSGNVPTKRGAKKYNFPSIPKNQLPKSRSKSPTDRCNNKLSEMRKKYKIGQKILDEVDKFMNKG
jgi:hypothetical protein